MILLIIYLILFITFTSFSVTILGDKNIISNNLISIKGMLLLLSNWRLYIALFAALLARITFTLINSQLYKMPSTSNNSTNISSLLSNTAIIGVLITNYLFLGELLTIKQGIGMVLIFIGVVVILIN